MRIKDFLNTLLKFRNHRRTAVEEHIKITILFLISACSVCNLLAR